MSVAIAERRLSELVPEDQAAETRERIKTPFPGRHEGSPVIVQAVFKRTAIVRESDEHEPYQVHVEDIEVDERDVVILPVNGAPRTRPWKRLEGEAETPARTQATREASDRLAERDAHVRRPGPALTGTRRRISRRTLPELEAARNEAASLAGLCAELADAARELSDGLGALIRDLDAARAIGGDGR